MKTLAAIFTLFTTLFVGVVGAGADTFLLETSVYVFRNAEFSSVTSSDGADGHAARGVVIRPPATVRFDGQTLSLAGPRFTWNDGPTPPALFSAVPTPTVPLVPRRAVTLSSTVPMQYMEKMPDGTLEVRDIPAGSPDAPYCRVTFTLEAEKPAETGLPLTCRLDVATVSARESVAGVSLPVGKPVLSRFTEHLSVRTRLDEWSALLLQSPNGSDYSLLWLFKVTVGESPAPVDLSTTSGPLTAPQLDQFAVSYYRGPRPELVSRAIEGLGASGFLEDRPDIYLGFFAGIFAANPDRVAAWQEVIERQDRAPRALLREAMKLDRQKQLLAAKVPSVGLNDRLWGAFFATGDVQYLERLIDHLQLLDARERSLFLTGLTAMWSLARNAPYHPAVSPALRSARENHNSRVRSRLTALLNKDVTTIRQELMALTVEPRDPPDLPQSHLPGITGERSFYFPGIGAGGGLPPPNSPGASLVTPGR